MCSTQVGPAIFDQKSSCNFHLLSHAWLAKAQAIVDEGLLDMLVNLEELNEFWLHMLRDFPMHPAASNPQTALPIKLYGAASPESRSMFSDVFESISGELVTKVSKVIFWSINLALLLYHIEVMKANLWVATTWSSTGNLSCPHALVTLDQAGF